MPEYLTPAQAADMLHVTPRTVYEWVRTGRLAALHAGGRRILITHEHINAFLGVSLPAVAVASSSEVTLDPAGSPLANRKRNGRK